MERQRTHTLEPSSTDGDVLTTVAGEATWATPPAGGGGAVAVEDEGAEVVAAATRFNFTGAGVTVTDTGAGEATVAIPGGGGGSGGGGVTPTLVASALTFVNGSSGSVVIPATAQAGDTAILFTEHGFAANVPANWISLDNSTGTNVNGRTFAKSIAAGDIGATVTVTYAGSYQGEIVLVIIRGAVRYRGVQSLRTTNTTGLVVGLPAGIETGDLTLLFGGARGTTVALSCDTGAQVARRDADTNAASAFYSRAHPTSAGLFPAPATWTFTGSLSGGGFYGVTVAFAG